MSHPDRPRSEAAEFLTGCVHTSGFPDLLRELGGCLVASTYQAGKLVVLRPVGDRIAAQSHAFHRPMGLAADRGRLALGTVMEITEFHDVPGAAARLRDPPAHDAVYLARRTHITGHIDIHEMAWDAGGDLWFANTLFSCLCTLDGKSSFVPRWRPSFVSHYAPEDRCHLNGLAMRDGVVRYVTALGETNTREGWRPGRHAGGVLIDVATGDALSRGLCMPHSPRWYDGRLWLLESGRGALCTVDPTTGARQDIARLPGFCRGIDFLGPVAFVGLSQRRGNASLADIPGIDDDAGGLAGIWAVHLHTGAILASFRFGAEVREIFAVQALPGVLSPDIVQGGERLDTAYALGEAG